MKIDYTTLIYAIIIVVVIIIIGILVYYYLPSSSWVSFKLNYGDTFQSSSVATSLQNINPAYLRWRNCQFTVINNGKTYTLDVTNILNTSSSVYLYYSKTTLNYDLIRPLNYLSFPIPTFSYKAATSTYCTADSDCNSTYKNNICVKSIPLPSDSVTSSNCTFFGGATTASSTIQPASDPSLEITVDTTGTSPSVYGFPAVPDQYKTSISYNTLYCKSNGSGGGYTVDWLQLVNGTCSLSGLASSGDSVTLTGYFRVFPYL